MRDAIAWASFVSAACNATPSASSASPSSASAPAPPRLSPWQAYVHGASLTLLDGLGLGLGMPEASASALRAACLAFLATQLPPGCEHALADAAFAAVPPQLGAADGAEDDSTPWFGVPPFVVAKARRGLSVSPSDAPHLFPSLFLCGAARCDDRLE